MSMDFKGMYVFSDQGVIEKIILKCVIQKCDVNLIRRLGVDCNEAVRVIKQGKGGGCLRELRDISFSR